ncbi:Spy/CpxP family protein refolding chaperone [Massilia horti]|uniref:Periplasmic heavy metal sensor n=1 Tax=Massilia horti TaxID=2562153 RepID=A0A4Y9T4U8_9BURK|nr:Spy/CpxP family protein refolding chaperone [Massilia horti]TFW32786.1 periplasmic heavy metal sensor [Massilia horti]
MKLSWICAFTLVVAALASSASAQSIPPQPDGPDHGPMHMGRGEHAMRGPSMHGPGLHLPRGVELSEAQQDRVFAIMHAQAPQRREIEKKVRAAHDELRTLTESGQFDETKASSQAQALGQATAAGALLRARTAAQLLAVLTPEQREQMHKVRDARRGRQQFGDARKWQ